MAALLSSPRALPQVQGSQRYIDAFGEMSREN